MSGCRLSKALALSVLAFAALSTGCHTMTVRSGLPPEARPFVKGRVTGAWMNGLADEEPMLDLGRMCPQGWSQIDYQVGFVTGVLNAFRGLIYMGTDVTVWCALAGPAPVAPPPMILVAPPPPPQVAPAPPPQVIVVPAPSPAPPAP